MSNQAVGSVYEGIIEDVIKKSKEDFEEGGVDETVLEALREGWKKKLSQLNVATFPWDPKPESTPAPAPRGSAATGAGPPPTSNYASQQLSPNAGNIPHPPAGAGANNQNGSADVLPKMEPTEHIKMEPGLTPNVMSATPYPNAAAARAQEHLRKDYGPRAANSIHAIQAGLPPHAQPMGAAAYRPPTAPGGPGQPNIPQNDGSGDFEAIMVERDSEGNLVEMGRVEIDRMLHERIMENAKAMEGGGLMVPLKDATKHSSTPRRATRGAGPSNVDGADDGLDDEDAINSDLDDPDDAHDNSEDEDEGLGHIMLCMYDKVQRVKNKWKCTLKDGILTVGGKEYVFHKATGEYEW